MMSMIKMREKRGSKGEKQHITIPNKEINQVEDEDA